MKFAIFQIRDNGIDEVEYKFCSYNEFKFQFSDYQMVCSMSINLDNEYDALETIFYKFNADIPVGFKGHSLSVSDLVRLTINNKYKFYYCDSFGWKDVTKVVERQYLENFVKDDFSAYKDSKFSY